MVVPSGHSVPRTPLDKVSALVRWGKISSLSEGTQNYTAINVQLMFNGLNKVDCKTTGPNSRLLSNGVGRCGEVIHK